MNIPDNILEPATCAAKNYLNEGVSMNETIAKVAMDCGLNSEQISRVCELANHLVNKVAVKEQDRYTDFVLADPEAVKLAVNALEGVLPSDDVSTMLSSGDTNKRASVIDDSNIDLSYEYLKRKVGSVSRLVRVKKPLNMLSPGDMKKKAKRSKTYDKHDTPLTEKLVNSNVKLGTVKVDIRRSLEKAIKVARSIGSSVGVENMVNYVNDIGSDLPSDVRNHIIQEALEDKHVKPKDIKVAFYRDDEDSKVFYKLAEDIKTSEHYYRLVKFLERQIKG